MELRDTIRTNGTVRRFTTDPVERSTVLSILDDARFASSGGNRQPWKVAIVEDRALRRELAVLMQPVWDEYLEPSAMKCRRTRPWSGGIIILHIYCSIIELVRRIGCCCSPAKVAAIMANFIAAITVVA